jgi:mono/diheme cytochrome c family protein
LISNEFNLFRHALVPIKGGTMKHLEGVMLGLPLLAATFAIGVTVAIGQTNSPQQQSQDKAPQKAVHATNQDRGQEVFEQNCARCHHAPAGFPSSISGTVAMHMRVRAGLSDADYKALRQFLNP